MKILFAGTPDFAVAPLQALLHEHTIVGAYTQPDRKSGRGKKLTPSPVKVFARDNNIPVFQPSSLANQSKQIRDLNADVMVVVAYGMLLPQEILDIPPLGCINIHASILPRWRGAAPIQRAIEAGDAETGVSIMRMEAGLDTGPVFQILSTDIKQDDTSASLHDRLAKLGADGITSTLSSLSQNPELKPTPQNNELASYAKKIAKSEAVIDWTLNAKQIDQRIRAFIPWPVCQSSHALNERVTRIRIWRATALEPPQADAIKKEPNNHRPGEILHISELGLHVACRSGVIRLELLQRDGGKPLPVREFCNGYPLTVGDILGA